MVRSATKVGNHVILSVSIQNADAALQFKITFLNFSDINNFDYALNCFKYIFHIFLNLKKLKTHDFNMFYTALVATPYNNINICMIISSSQFGS